MRIELINTGSELMLGRVLNTHQQWICRQLADLGYEVSRQICVADDGPADPGGACANRFPAPISSSPPAAWGRLPMTLRAI